jgi:hypothetical protein
MSRHNKHDIGYDILPHQAPAISRAKRLQSSSPPLSHPRRVARLAYRIAPQIDDPKAERLPPHAPAALLKIETSPGNFQAWLVLPSMVDRDFARRLRKGSGARTRPPVARPASPAARTSRTSMHPTSSDCDPAVWPTPISPIGLAWLQHRAQPLRVAPPVFVSAGGNRRWPSYERCVDRALMNSEETGPDISRADFVFCMTAITWGWRVAETADRVMEKSSKAQRSDRAYAELTARNAVVAVERRQQEPKRRPLTS